MPDWKKALEEALAQERSGHHAEARERCLEVLAARPDLPDAVHLLGVAEYGLGRLDAGIAHLERAMQLRPKRYDFQQNYGAVLLKGGRYQAAARVFGSALKLDPGARKSLAGLAIAVTRSLDATEAVPAGAAAAPADKSVSVIVCSIDEAKRKRIRGHYERLFAGRRFELIQIPDARSLCEAYNRGLARSSGEVVVFSHDDIEIVSDDFAGRLLAHLEQADVLGIAGTTRLVDALWARAGWPHVHGCIIHTQRRAGVARYYADCFGAPRTVHGAQAVDGVLFAARREVCEALRFDEETFDGFHVYDVDFSYRAYLSGFRVAIGWDMMLVHDSTGQFGPAWRGYAERFAAKHRATLPAEPPPRGRLWTSVKLARHASLGEFHRRMLAACA